MSNTVRTRGSQPVSYLNEAGLDIPPSEVLQNPGLLKLALMASGVRVACDLPATQHASFQPSAFATAFELDLILPEGTMATVAVQPSLTKTSPYVLERDETGYRLSTAGGTIPVTLLEQPAFIQKKTSSGVPFGRFATMHGGYLALSPVSECAFLGTPSKCRFCSLTGTSSGATTRIPVDDVVEAVRAAQAERPIQMIYLSVGYIDGPDSGVAVLEPYVRALKNCFNVLVAVDALPPRDNAWIDRTYAMGVDSISYNLEIFAPDWFERLCPGPSKLLGRDRFLEALSYATTVFNDGAVISHLIVGLEPLEHTLDAIDKLVDLRVVPVLPVLRPFKGIDLRSDASKPLGLAELSGVYAHLYQRLRSHRIPMGWVRDISVVTTPTEGRFFVGADSALSRIASHLWRSPDRKPSPRLVDLRRSLRVVKS